MHRLDQIRAQISAPILIHPHVKSALLENKPVVALESTILAHGMPFPQNLETARQVEQIVRDNGAIPATIAVMNGILKIGLSDQELEIIARKGNQCRKVSRRDLAAVLASREFGATTVSGTMIAAEMSGIDVFVTGGIGGVHRGAEVSMDISADLLELGKTSVAVVCAGVKSILDIPKTLEVLETQGTAVAVLNSEEFPAFFTRKSGSPAPMVVQSEKECAGIILNSKKLGLKSGMVFAVPIPDESDGEFIEKATQLAIQEAERNKIIGKDITPFLLKRISELTKGNSLKLSEF
jgi:pseudouridine-5'-phosphate glycosidase